MAENLRVPIIEICKKKSEKYRQFHVSICTRRVPRSVRMEIYIGAETAPVIRRLRKSTAAAAGRERIRF